MSGHTVQEIDSNSGLYPPLLKEVSCPPATLFVKGELTEGYFENCLGIVGSRKAGIYIKKVVKYVCRELSGTDIVVVSGFTQGVDSEAHLWSMEFGLKTVAVLPCGLDVARCGSNSLLYEQILSSKGLMVSEFESDFEPKKWTYPKRNRTVAGVCKALLVIGARESSGSLITASYMKRFGRKVWVAPGEIFDESFHGSHRILSEYAHIFYSIDAVREFFGIQKRQRIEAVDICHQHSDVEKTIVNNLKASGSSIDEILCQTSLPISTVNKVLGDMQLRGLVSEESGLYYVN